MKKLTCLILIILYCYPLAAQENDVGKRLNIKADGFKGIWYSNQKSNDEYVFKYSGGLGTYCAKHRPFAVYSEKAEKTFFCFGASDDQNSTLFHNVSYFDHKTGAVANPTVVLDKHTTDAHDNPVISMDKDGFIWIFSTSHGTSRPSYISKSTKPFDISEIEPINATEIVDGKTVPFNNFSYFQVWYVKEKGFMAFFTKYQKDKNDVNQRVIGYNTSKDGVQWGEWKIIARIDKGHYQISGENNGNFSVAFNYHPDEGGLNWRTNLYYLQTPDFGQTWTNGNGKEIKLPLTQIDNNAKIKDYKKDGLNCYLKDLAFDKKGNPVILVISSKGYESGPKNDPRTWEILHYNGKKWVNHNVTTSDNNYDMGSLYITSDKQWKIIAPTEPGPQRYNPGGEIALWISNDAGKSWEKEKQLTYNSPQNHTYVRRPVNFHGDFFGLWADGNCRKVSESNIYFCNKDGKVYKLPREIKTGKQTIIPKIYDGGADAPSDKK